MINIPSKTPTSITSDQLLADLNLPQLFHDLENCQGLPPDRLRELLARAQAASDRITQIRLSQTFGT